MLTAYLKMFASHEHMRAALMCQYLDMPRLFRECAKNAHKYPLDIMQVSPQHYLLRCAIDDKGKTAPLHSMLRDGNTAVLNPVVLITEQASQISQFKLPFNWQLFNTIITQVPMHAHNDGLTVIATTPNGKSIRLNHKDIILKEED